MSNPVKSTLKTESVPIILILMSFAASLYFYAHFPAKVPTHWNYKGQIDGYSGKAFAAFFFPLLNLGLYLLFLVLPYLDPRKDSYQQFAKVYHIFKGSIVAFLTLVYFYVGYAGLGYNLPVSVIISLGLGVLFVVLGNYMAKIKSNWFFGIRTPWTLSNEEVWNKRHRLGGKLFILAGVLLILVSFLPMSVYWAAFLTVTSIAAIIPVIYSYLLYRKIGKNKSN